MFPPKFLKNLVKISLLMPRGSAQIYRRAAGFHV